MYEIDRKNATAPRPTPAPLPSYEHAQDIAAASFLSWGEHCVECAEPSCFQTCDLYSRRPDGRCRRFTHGIVRNDAFPSARGYGAEISFKKWGKLEARGNVGLTPYKRLLAIEELVNGSRPVIDALGAAISRITGDPRWRLVRSRMLDRIIRRLHARPRHGLRPDVFLLEIFNPDNRPAVLQVSMTVARKRLAQRGLNPTTMLPSFRERVELPPGYSRHEIPYEKMSPVTESGLPFDIALIPEADSNPTLVFLCADFVRYAAHKPSVSPVADDKPAVKCVVWDLDNTMWKGVLLEDDNIQVDTEVLDLIKTLDSRGVLLSVASKNDFTLAHSKLQEIGIEEYILYPQINWQTKSESIKTIAEKLNIGLDTFVFIDDNEFELNEVARALPMVTCVNALDVANLAENPRLQGSTTDEAQRRRLMYRQAMQRDEEQSKFGDNFFEFLRSCDIKLRLLRYSSEYFERVCELLQRTNQLNFSGRKYRRDEIGPILADPGLEKWVLECSDRYGSYGVVGFGLVARRGEEVRIEDFMLSCRVQARFVEQAFFAALIEDHPSVRRITVNFTATGRNTPAQQVLLAMGFEEGPEQKGRMMMDLQERDLTCDFIQVEREPALEAVE